MNRFIAFLAVLLTCSLFAGPSQQVLMSRSTATGGGGGTPVIVSRLSTEFPTTQGENGWEAGYLTAFDPTSFSTSGMTYASGAWTKTGGTSGTPFVGTGSNGWHPGLDNGDEAAMRWTSDYTGTVEVRIDATLYSNLGFMTVAMFKNSSTTVLQGTECNLTDVFQTSFSSVSVVPGDVLTFMQYRQAHPGSDFTYVDIIISRPWTTLTTENMDGVTAPAVPSAFTDKSGNVVTTTTNPQSGTNALVTTSTAGTLDHAYFSATDGHGGDARTTMDVRIESGGSAYVEAQAIVRAGAKTSGVSSCYLINFYRDSGDVAKVQVFKRVSGSSSALSTAMTGVTLGAYYRCTIEAEGTIVRGRVQRKSDDYYLNPADSWQVTPTDFFTVTDSSVTGAGYQGVQFYRDSGGAQVTVDNVQADAKF